MYMYTFNIVKELEIHALVCEGHTTCKGRATLVKYIMEMKRKLDLLASSALFRQ